MALAVFSAAQAYPLDQDGFEVEPDRGAIVVRFGRGRNEQRASLAPRRFRTYRVGFRVSATKRDAIDAFFEALADQQTAFLWQDPLNYVVSGLALGTSAALQVLFPLPTTNGYGGEHPQNVVQTLLYDDGVSIARTVQTDDRTLTAGAAPAAGSVMTADVHYYRRLALAAPYSWRRLGGGAVYETQMTWREVAA